MGSSGSIVYDGPSGSVGVVNPPIANTTYQNLLATALFWCPRWTMVVAAVTDEAIANILVANTTPPPTTQGVVGIMAESAVFGGTFRVGWTAIVPPGWYYRWTSTTAGTGTVTCNGAVGYA